MAKTGRNICSSKSLYYQENWNNKQTTEGSYKYQSSFSLRLLKSKQESLDELKNI